MINSHADKRLKELLGREHYSTKPEDLVLYGSDGTNRPDLRPDAVARPSTVQEIASIIEIASRYKIPVIPRGAGSGLTGGALPVDGGLVVVMTRFNKILEIDEDNLIAVVEPGVVTSDFQNAVQKHGLFYPPDPASREFSTLGGNVAENAGGTRAVKYGVTRDYVMGLQAVIGTGETIETGVRTAKGVVGYDLTRLLVGSEGTLGFITKLILRLIPAPETKETVTAYFSSLDEAAQTVAAMTSARVVPATLEFMDQASISCVEDFLGLGLDKKMGGLLLIETDGPKEQALAEAETAARLCRENGAVEVRRAKSVQEAENMWRARRAISPALFRTATGKANEDIVVPRSKIPEMVQRINEISKKHDLQIISFGHAGDGNIHVNIMYDKHDAAQAERAEHAVRDVMATTLELGGTLSGEHGIGTTKQAFIDMELSEASINLMKNIKKVFDPQNIMNPGKIFPK